MPPSNLSWAALFAMMSAAGCGSSSAGECNTDELPATDPCYMRGCCDAVKYITHPDGSVEVIPDGVDGGPDVQSRFCGACNG